ncbi:MAG: pantoate--beta-alanine ligase [Sulfuricellaceae bacterium]|jgi:pantoate--beta-alanine ligase
MTDLIHDAAALRARLARETAVAFVPTMGNLHEGHVSLVRQAREHGSCVVTSIFVNPLQFGPNEDFDQYPRTLEADCAKLEGLVDVVFAPSVAEMYPVPQQIFVEPPPVAAELCGAFRPGHFRGVTTVVLKLFNLVQPQVAVFGKKDYQQFFILKEMARQLNLPIALIGAETRRAEDGLALSSRNGYLSAGERAEATRLYRTLSRLREALQHGEGDFSRLEASARADLEGAGWRVDYVSVRSADTLLPPLPGETRLVVLAAAWLGSTRLIDNVEVTL